MCKICDAMDKLDHSNPAIESVNDQLSASALGHTGPDTVTEVFTTMMEARGLAIRKEHAASIGPGMFALGVRTASFVAAPQLTFQVKTINDFFDGLRAMATKYAATPSVMNDLVPMLNTMKAYAERDIKVATKIILGVAADSGVRKTLVTGEESDENLLVEEYLMIGERAKAKLAEHPIGGLLLQLYTTPDGIAGLGKKIIKLHIDKYAELQRVTPLYIAGDFKPFAELMASVTGADHA